MPENEPGFLLRMRPRSKHNSLLSRRTFLQGMSLAPLALLPAPLSGLFFDSPFSPAVSDLRLHPHYPAKSPLDDILRQFVPGGDEFPTEKYAWDISAQLEDWGKGLTHGRPALDTLSKFLDPSMQGVSLVPAGEVPARRSGVVEVVRRKFDTQPIPGRERFLQSMKAYLAPLASIETAEFQILAIEEVAGSPSAIDARIRYDLVGVHKDTAREERIGLWNIRWQRDAAGGWWVVRWEAGDEVLSRNKAGGFVDVSSQAFGHIDSYRSQMLHGVDYWRTVLDGACGIDVYGNNGIAAGDFDNDGFDDLYICQPAGLPNRLYRNRGDGTFEDVTAQAGVDVLDATACALFADFENKGLQDLLVVCAGGPMLFVNQGKGKFQRKPDAFKFAESPQGTFTHAAIADYDRDGRLDIYLCLYSYYQGLDQYRYPAPYYDARNGPPNFLMHNEGGLTFQDRTRAAGLNVGNDRYSFACAWGDSNGNGLPDLYVANDFGRGNFYRNRGDGTFTSASAESGVEVPGAGMSACWSDFDNDGKQDIYVANMWSAAGLRVSAQKQFREKDPEDIRNSYRQHANGNSLYRNLGDGKFRSVAQQAGVEMGRWAWSCDAWDFDHDGFSDLYCANGYISGSDPRDLSSFFWRQVVAKSPQAATSSLPYEQGWNAINELVRSDASWSGRERNVLYQNNQDGTFSEISGILGLDFPDDSRAFASADLDGDGRLEMVLKNRSAPQLRLLGNATSGIGSCISFRLRGTRGNRDAIGAAVTVEAPGLRQTRYLQAGSGFLSQHTKELFFGLGNNQGTVHVSILWPSGGTQSFDQVPVNQRIEIEEGSSNFSARPFASESRFAKSQPSRISEELPSEIETWLLEPLPAPDFSLPDLNGNLQKLQSLRGGHALMIFWSYASSSAAEPLRAIKQAQPAWKAAGLRILAICVDETPDASGIKSLAATDKLSFPIVLATTEIAGIYNIVYRYLFDRRRDMGIPTSFLLDRDGLIVKIYQGRLNPARVVDDVKSAPKTPAERMAKALPLRGTLYQGSFARNDFTYGVAFFQRGYLDQAAASFQQVIRAKPDYPEAYYNLGTLELQRKHFADARRYLEQTVKLRSNYPEAWNNLGMLAAQEGNEDDAIRNFRESLQLRPNYTVALLNLGNLYRRQGQLADSEQLLQRAINVAPDDPEANYGLGMLYARQDQVQQALDRLQRAVSLRPDYAEARNNLGVLLVREQRYAEAEEQFKTCIRVAPDFDQAYLNLARLYVLNKDNERAKAVLQDLLRLQPRHQVARQALEMLQ